MCLNCVAGRWMIRTAYGIPGGALDDTLKAALLPCCSVNQLYQTTKRYGNPASYGGRQFNQDNFRSNLKKDVAYNCILSTFCNSCAVGSSLETAMGMVSDAQIGSAILVIYAFRQMLTLSLITTATHLIYVQYSISSSTMNPRVTSPNS